MTSRRARTKDLAGSGHLETFCDRFAGLAASDRLWHRARKITAADWETTPYFSRVIPSESRGIPWKSPLRFHGGIPRLTLGMTAWRLSALFTELAPPPVSGLASLAIADERLRFERADRAGRAWRERDDFFRFRTPIRKARSYSRW
jgi:hypothetical protein